MTPVTLLYSPFPDADAARTAARALVSERLAACANIVPGVSSVYEWQGTMTEETEAVLWVKTLPAKASEAAVRLRRLHPYECPCILTFPAKAGEDYAAWMERTLSAAWGA